jgi:hypothetical protein
MMTTDISAAFEVTSWDEHAFDDSDGGVKLTEAVVAKAYTGDIDGTSSTRWLMTYAPDETAVFIGLERITGRVGDAEGTLVLQHVGEFRDGAATATLTVVGAAGGLAGASGSGDFRADPGGSIALHLD